LIDEYQVLDIRKLRIVGTAVERMNGSRWSLNHQARHIANQAVAYDAASRVEIP